MSKAPKKNSQQSLIRLQDVLEQLQELKAANEQIKSLKESELKYQRNYFRNCTKVLNMLQDKRKDFALESLSMIDSSVCQISNDVQAFKNIRNRLFSQITEEIQREQQKEKMDSDIKVSLDPKDDGAKHQRTISMSSQSRTINNNKLYLYLFHLFESVISNVSQLVSKTLQTTLKECGELGLNEDDLMEKGADAKKKADGVMETMNTINTIATGSELVTNGENKNGFFSENVKQIAKSRKSIEKAIDRISGQLLIYNQDGREQRAMREKVQKFIAQLPEANVDNSFEVRWSLSELEDIVYDFINAHELPPEFQVASAISQKGLSKKDTQGLSAAEKHAQALSDKYRKKDVEKEDLMKVAKANKDDNLPQMVRDYILHDRGNSLFLGDSFGNLPSPVAEGATIKKLFKFNDDDPVDKKRKNESKNQAIRIEGKKDKEKSEQKDKSPEKVPKKDFQVDIDVIDRIVFDNPRKAKRQGAKKDSYQPYGSQSYSKLPQKGNHTRSGQTGSKKSSSNTSINDSKQSIKPYEEEESYENPVNLSKAPGMVDEYFDIRSEYEPKPLHNPIQTSIGTSKGFVHIDNLHIDDFDVNVYKDNDTDSRSKDNIVISSEETVKLQQRGNSNSKTDKTQNDSQTNVIVCPSGASNAASHIKPGESAQQDKASERLSNSQTGNGRREKIIGEVAHPIKMGTSALATNVVLEKEVAKREQSPASHENSSCKNTVKMTDRREFSFFESQANSNIPFNNKSQKNLLARKPNEYWNQPNGNGAAGNKELSGAWGSVNDTVSRLQGINSSQLSKQDGLFVGPDGTPMNPFIHDSYLFQTSQGMETNNFGGSVEGATNLNSFIHNSSLGGGASLAYHNLNSVHKGLGKVNTVNQSVSSQLHVEVSPTIFTKRHNSVTPQAVLSANQKVGEYINSSAKQTTRQNAYSIQTEKKGVTKFAVGSTDSAGSRNDSQRQGNKKLQQFISGSSAVDHNNLISKSVSLQNFDSNSQQKGQVVKGQAVVRGGLDLAVNIIQTSKHLDTTDDFRNSQKYIGSRDSANMKRLGSSKSKASAKSNRKGTTSSAHSHRSTSNNKRHESNKTPAAKSSQQVKQLMAQANDYPGLFKTNDMDKNIDSQLKVALNQRNGSVSLIPSQSDLGAQKVAKSRQTSEVKVKGTKADHQHKSLVSNSHVQSQPQIGVRQPSAAGSQQKQQYQQVISKETEKAYDFYARNNQTSSSGGASNPRAQRQSHPQNHSVSSGSKQSQFIQGVVSRSKLPSGNNQNVPQSQPVPGSNPFNSQSSRKKVNKTTGPATQHSSNSGSSIGNQASFAGVSQNSGLPQISSNKNY